MSFYFLPNSYITGAKVICSTLHDIYELEFQNAYDAADLLLKHRIVDFEPILQSTEDRLRKPLFDEVSKRHKRREKRRIDYSTKVTRSPDR